MTSLGLDQEFESGVRLIRDAYTKKLSEKDEEIVHVRGENARKDAELRELRAKVVHLESQLVRADRKLAEMSKSAAKLYHFKQSVLDSFEAEDYSEIKRKLVSSKDSRSSFARSPSPKLADTSASRRSIPAAYGTEETELSSNFQTGHGEHSADAYDTDTTLSRRAATSFSILRDYSPVRNGEPSQQISSKPARSSVTRDQRTNATRLSHAERQSSSARVTEALQSMMSTDSVSYPAHSSTAPSESAALESVLPPQNMNNVSSRRHSPAKTTAPVQTGAGADAVVDGRDFFKRAKSVLSYDDFTGLLATVKSYNSREQTRQKTLESAYRSFGQRQPEMYAEFEKLLSH